MEGRKRGGREGGNVGGREGRQEGEMSYAPFWPCKIHRHHCAAAAPMTPFQSRINQASRQYRG